MSTAETNLTLTRSIHEFVVLCFLLSIQVIIKNMAKLRALIPISLLQYGLINVKLGRSRFIQG